MRNMFLSGFVVAATLVAVSASAATPSRHSDHLASMLNLRLRSIELQIDTLKDRALIGREEAQGLRAEARRLEQRLYRSSEREAAEIEPAVDRLQDQLRSATDYASLGNYRRRDLGRFDDGDRYERDRDGYSDRDTYRRADPRGDPFAIWQERDERGPH